MASEIKAFLDKALPKDKGGHVLVFGETHTELDHVLYLKEHLQELQDDHNVGVIGLEFGPMENVFLWAYQDKTLTKLLGSKENAQRFLHQIMLHVSLHAKPEDATDLRTELAIEALDKGMRVVCFDSRFGSQVEHVQPPEYYKKSIAEYADKIGKNADDVIQELRQDYTSHPEIQGRWYVYEYANLLQLQPSYRDRLKHRDHIRDLGIEKNIGSDALSSVLLNAAIDPSKNTIPIIGYHHIDLRGNIGSSSGKKNNIGRIHGAFPDHIGWTRPELTVQTAYMATTGQLSDHMHAYSGWFPNIQLSHNPYVTKNGYAPSLRDSPTAGIDITKHVVTPFPTLSKSRYCNIYDRFLTPWSLKDTPEKIAQRVNPLLIPEIKKAYDAVREDWNPGMAEQKQR